MKSCNRKILELFYNAKHSGRIMKPDAIGRFGESDEGLVIELTWRVIGGVIADAKFRAFGNPNAIAIASLMTGSIIGKSIEDALGIDEQVIIDALDEFRPEYLEVYDVMRECISDAYNNYIKRQERKEYSEEVLIDNYIPAEQSSTELTEEENQDYIAKQVQREIRMTTQISVSRGRGRPRKEVDSNAIVEVGEKRGRGRPRKVVDPSVEVIETVKRGRGRPRKEIDPNAMVEVGPKRGRGRPRKEVDPNAVVVVGEKRGRGRPRKVIDETIEVETVKRGRGRPRKEIDPNAIIEVGPKRGRGRPRKEVDPNAMVIVGEKRGRGRPRKVIDEAIEVETVKRGRGRPRKEKEEVFKIVMGEKRGRGRPKKEIKYNFPTDLDEVEYDEDMEELINGSNYSKFEPKQKIDTEINSLEHVKDDDIKQINSVSLEKDQPKSSSSILDDDFDDNYDLFKSNIRNILSGRDVKSAPEKVVSDITITKEVKVTTNSNEIVQEKRGRGRPKKEFASNTGRINTPASASSLTRSLSTNGMTSHNTQDILFASKNVTTTNVNAEKSSNSSESQVVRYSISEVKKEVEVSIPKQELVKDEEIEIEPVKVNTRFADFEDDLDEIEVDEANEDVSKIKDEAPAGGLSDLLKALLDD